MLLRDPYWDPRKLFDCGRSYLELFGVVSCLSLYIMYRALHVPAPSNYLELAEKYQHVRARKKKIVFKGSWRVGR